VSSNTSNTPFVRSRRKIDPFDIVGQIKLKDPKDPLLWFKLGISDMYTHYLRHVYSTSVETAETNYRGMFICEIRGCPVTALMRKKRKNWINRKNEQRRRLDH
jgi:hypothetical protein